MARGRDYQGRYWADGETAMHSKRKSAQNSIAKTLRTIKIWQRFAEAPAGEKAVARAEREIAALRRSIEREERFVGEMDAAIAEWEDRQRELQPC